MNSRLIFRKSSKFELGTICVDQFWLLQAERRGDPSKQVPYELEYASDGMDDDVRIIFVEDPISECIKFSRSFGSGSERRSATTQILRNIWAKD